MGNIACRCLKTSEAKLEAEKDLESIINEAQKDIKESPKSKISHKSSVFLGETQKFSKTKTSINNHQSKLFVI
jgi:hypothetical protein